MGPEIVKTTAENLDKLVTVDPPTAPKDLRHTLYKDWVKNPENAGFAEGPSGRSGIWHLGLWKELGHETFPNILTADTCQGPARLRPLKLEFLEWCGNLTKTFEFWLDATDKDMKQKYLEQYRALHCGLKDKAMISGLCDKELFPLTVVLVNLYTEPHFDAADWQAGMT